MKQIIIITTILLVTTIVSHILYFRLGWFKRLYHDELHWHVPDENSPRYFDGCSLHDTCKYCNQDIIQDSQGNWFIP